MFVYNHQQRTRYRDTDQMGYVYYGNYGYYYEEARVEAIRSLGLTYKEMETDGTITPVTRMNIKYIQVARYDEMLTIRTIFPEMPSRILVIKYEVYNERNKLINEGETHMLFIDVKTQRIKPAPAILLDKLKPFFERKMEESEQSEKYNPYVIYPLHTYRKTA